MRRVKRAFAVTLQIVVLFVFEGAGCSSNGAPSAPASGGSGGSGGTSTGSSGSGGNAGGSGGSGGTSTGSGGSAGTSAGSGGSAGATTGSGGSAGTTGSGGSAGTTGSGGSAGTTGSGGSAGTSTGSGGSAGASADSGAGGAGGVADAGGGKDGDAGGLFSPLCSDVPLTSAGEVPTKGGVCTPTDAQLCYKTCGPLSVGFKSETCTSGVYVEQSGCSFPDADYSCYKIPAAISATCPTTTPQASQTCGVAECVLCNVVGNYLDTSSAAKPGYCVCPAGPDSGTRKWSCASTTAWPCPGGKGC